jgi:Ca2+-binding RTX toxin-like protein
MIKQRDGIATRFLVLATAFLILMAPIFMVVPTQKAFAANKTWDGGGDGTTWEDCNNWSENICPAANDAITIGSGFDVILDNGFTLGTDGSLTLESGATLYFEDETLSNHGMIHNSGRIDFDYHERTGLSNIGTIINDGYFGGKTELENSGTIQNNVGGTMEIVVGDGWENTGTIINEGTFLNNMGISNHLGTITNKCGGIFTNQDSVIGNPVINEPCSAADKTWDGGGDGEYWTNCPNWNEDTCPTGNDTITIGSGFTIQVDGVVLNNGGSITISSGSKLVLFEDGMENGGTIHNKGTLEIEHNDGIEFHNTGTVINDGLFENQGATINHPTGIIQNNAGSTFAIHSGGNVVNDGSIVNKCGATFSNEGILNGDGTMENEPCSPVSCDNPTITGTDGNDVIDGTPGADIIDAKGGDDKINGLGGNDIICGGAGDDTINGGSGSDTIFGGKGNDSISGGKGNDTLNGGAGNDSISGNGGNDNLIGSSGNDSLSGLDGTANNDSLDGGFGTDTCNSNPDPEVSCEA